MARTFTLTSAICGSLGVCISGLLFIILTTHSGYRSTRMSKYGMDNTRQVLNLTDTDILRSDHLLERIFYSMALFRRKMKYLKDKGLVHNHGKKSTCTSNSKSVCVDKECKTSIAPVGSFEVFSSITKPLSFIRDGVLEGIPKVFGTDILPRRKYVFLIGISENHYLESQATIQSLHEHVFPHINNYTLYIYDMGLSQEQRKIIGAYDKAELRTYPFHLLPPRVHMFKNFTWKAIMIQAHIDKADYVVYSDASVRFVKGSDSLFNLAKETGFLMCPSAGGRSLAVQTSAKMFKYFGDESCSYSAFVEYEGGFLVFKNEPFARTVILEPWVACALDPQCMSGARDLGNCGVKGRYSKCHRFDMSAMTVILVKLFRENIPTISARRGRFHHIKQGRTNVKDFLKDLLQLKS